MDEVKRKELVPFPKNCVEREDWGARDAKNFSLLAHPILSVILTHTDTPRCKSKKGCMDMVRSIQQRDTDSGRMDIRYNFLVGGDGRVYEGRGWCRRPRKSLLYPEQYKLSIELSYIGFKGTRPTIKEYRAGHKLIKKGIYNMYMIKTPTFYSDL